MFYHVRDQKGETSMPESPHKTDGLDRRRTNHGAEQPSFIKRSFFELRDKSAVIKYHHCYIKLNAYFYRNLFVFYKRKKMNLELFGSTILQNYNVFKNFGTFYRP